MASIITATTTNGLTQAADNSGVLQLASGAGNLITVPSVTGTMLTSASSITRSQLPVGSVLQVVSQTFQGTQFNTSSNSMVATGFGTSITRASATSNILVLVSTSLTWGGSGMGLAIYRGTTLAWNPSIADSLGFYGAIFSSHGIVSLQYLDTPPAGSSFTYNLYAASRSSTSSTVNLTGAVNNGGTTITLMEIAA